jgi:hypothetical protein
MPAQQQAVIVGCYKTDPLIMTKLLSILSFVFIFISCQKEVSIDNGQNPTPIPTTILDTNLISKIIGFDTTKAIPFDTTFILNYQYDNLNRVTKISFLDYNNSGAYDVLNNNKETQTNTFLGNDTLPNKTVSISTSQNNEFNRTIFYTYSANAILAKDSIIFSQTQPTQSSLEIETNKFLSTATTKKQFVYNYFNNTTDTISINITSQNNNILNQQNNSQNWGINNFTLTYDTMINPFKKLNTLNTQYPSFIYGQNWIFTKGIVNSYRMANNVTRILLTNVNGSGQNFQCDYVYKYNINRYPVEMVFRNFVNGSYLRPNINKLKFYYR